MNTEQQIGFDKVKEMWSQLAISTYAKEQIAEAAVITDEKELLRQLKETTEARNMIENLGNPPLQDVEEYDREPGKSSTAGRDRDQGDHADRSPRGLPHALPAGESGKGACGRGAAETVPCPWKAVWKSSCIL